jgi:hypothetical protein
VADKVHNGGVKFSVANNSEVIWFLYNSESQERFDELTFSQAIKALDKSILFQSDLQVWMAWSEGMDDWACIQTLPEFLKELKHKPEVKRVAPPPIPIPKKKKKTDPPAVELPVVQFDANYVSSSKSAGQNQERSRTRRRFERYSIRLRVVIFKGDQSFRTYTRDLSEGGMLLENKVPETFLDGTCEIFIGSPNLKENIQFHGEVIGDANNPHRFAFVEKGENSVQRMAQWFALFNALKSKAAS